jgi:glucose/arabinose dehydrogenase
MGHIEFMATTLYGGTLMIDSCSPIRSSLAALLALMIVSFTPACSPAEAPELESPPESDGALVFETTHYPIRLVSIAEGLSNPYTLAFLPDGDILVTLMNGQVRIIRDGELAPDPVGVVPDVHFLPGSGGLMDIALHPDFADNNLIYFTYNKPGAEGSTNALARGTFDGTQLTDVSDVFVSDAWGMRDGNLSSRMAFAPDSTLYMAVSHHGLQDRAQEPGDHLGKVLRLNDDGSAPEDNPFVGRAGYRPEIFTFGHRNLHGVAIQPETGEPWTQEHGDEVNLMVAGANYGWPYLGVGGAGGGQAIGNPPPDVDFTEPYIAMSTAMGTHGLMFYSGNTFPEWQGSIFIGGSRSLGIRRFEVGEDGPGLSEDLFTDFQEIRDVRQGPDGLIYFITNGDPGTVMRIEPVQN